MDSGIRPMEMYLCMQACPLRTDSCISPRSTSLQSSLRAATGIRILVPPKGVTSCSYLLSRPMEMYLCMQACPLLTDSCISPRSTSLQSSLRAATGIRILVPPKGVTPCSYLLSRPMPEYPLMRAWRLFWRRPGTYTIKTALFSGLVIPRGAGQMNCPV